MACSEKLTQACAELASLARAPLLCARPGSRRWQALALRRDLRALKNAMPAHGLSQVPSELNAYKEFERFILQTLSKLDEVAAAAACRLPTNALYGPWEGGIATAELVPDVGAPAPFPLHVLSWNVRGAFGSMGTAEFHTGRILEAVKLLHEQGVGIAVISEPGFAEGMLWPDWTNYDFHGARSAKPDTVAVLTLSNMEKMVVPISDVGDERAIWLEVRLQQDSPGLLLLAAYGPHSSRPAHERIAFFEQRNAELCSTRSRYQDWRVLVTGDLNFHDGDLSTKNESLEAAVDRSITMLLTLPPPSGMGVVMRGPFEISTHASGSTIDVALSSASLRPSLQVLDRLALVPRSDHSALLLSDIGAVQPDSQCLIGKSRWCALVHEWDAALSLVPGCLDFITAWVLVILHDTLIRDSLVDGRCRKLRQALIDKAVWWRSVIFSLAGHMAGLAITSRADGMSEASRARSRMEQLLLGWHPSSDASSAADLELADAVLGSDQHSKVARFLQW